MLRIFWAGFGGEMYHFSRLGVEGKYVPPSRWHGSGTEQSRPKAHCQVRYGIPYRIPRKSSTVKYDITGCLENILPMLRKTRYNMGYDTVRSSDSYKQYKYGGNKVLGGGGGDGTLKYKNWIEKLSLVPTNNTVAFSPSTAACSKLLVLNFLLKTRHSSSRTLRQGTGTSQAMLRKQKKKNTSKRYQPGFNNPPHSKTKKFTTHDIMPCLDLDPPSRAWHVYFMHVVVGTLRV